MKVVKRLAFGAVFMVAAAVIAFVGGDESIAVVVAAMILLFIGLVFWANSSW